MPDQGMKLARSLWPWLESRLGGSKRKPFILGICGAQGSGKSTLADNLARELRDRGLCCATLSLDDLYLSGERRLALAQSVHPLFRTRGVPGTHDLELGHRVFDSTASEKGSLSLPRFDKLADEPVAAKQWPRVQTPLDLLIFEGWCVGAHPQDEAALHHPVNVLEAKEDPDALWRGHVNQELADGYQRFFSRLDASILLRAPSFGVVASWRMEQERNLAGGKRNDPGKQMMDEPAIRRFIMFFERITEHILSQGEGWFDLVVDLDKGRRAVSIREKKSGMKRTS